MAARRSQRQPVLQPEAVVILYNTRTGMISHTHFFSAASGEKLPDKEELERVAYAHAEKDGCSIRTHKAMHIDPTMLKRGMGYRVVVRKRAPTLVEVKAGRQRPQNLLRDA